MGRLEELESRLCNLEADTPDCAAFGDLADRLERLERRFDVKINNYDYVKAIKDRVEALEGRTKNLDDWAANHIGVTLKDNKELDGRIEALEKENKKLWAIVGGDGARLDALEKENKKLWAIVGGDGTTLDALEKVSDYVDSVENDIQKMWGELLASKTKISAMEKELAELKYLNGDMAERDEKADRHIFHAGGLEPIQVDDCCAKRDFYIAHGFVHCKHCTKPAPDIRLDELVALGWTEADARALWLQEAKKGNAECTLVARVSEWLSTKGMGFIEMESEKTDLSLLRIPLTNGKLPILVDDCCPKRNWDCEFDDGTIRCNVCHEFAPDITLREIVDEGIHLEDEARRLGDQECDNGNMEMYSQDVGNKHWRKMVAEEEYMPTDWDKEMECYQHELGDLRIILKDGKLPELTSNTCQLEEKRGTGCVGQRSGDVATPASGEGE